MSKSPSSTSASSMISSRALPPPQKISKSSKLAIGCFAIGVIAYLAMHFVDCGNIDSLNIPFKDLSFVALLPGAILAFRKFQALKSSDRWFLSGLILAVGFLATTVLTFFYANLGSFTIHSSFPPQIPYSVLFTPGIILGGLIAKEGFNKAEKERLEALGISPKSRKIAAASAPAATSASTATSASVPDQALASVPAPAPTSPPVTAPAASAPAPAAPAPALVASAPAPTPDQAQASAPAPVSLLPNTTSQGSNREHTPIVSGPLAVPLDKTHSLKFNPTI